MFYSLPFIHSFRILDVCANEQLTRSCRSLFPLIMTSDKPAAGSSPTIVTVLSPPSHPHGLVFQPFDLSTGHHRESYKRRSPERHRIRYLLHVKNCDATGQLVTSRILKPDHFCGRHRRTMAQRTMSRNLVLSNQWTRCQSAKLVSCRWYSSSSTGLLEQGEIPLDWLESYKFTDGN